MLNRDSLEEVHPLFCREFPVIKWLVELDGEVGFDSDFDAIKAFGAYFNLVDRTRSQSLYAPSNNLKIFQLSKIGVSMNYTELKSVYNKIESLCVEINAFIYKKLELTDNLLIPRFGKMAGLSPHEVEFVYYCVASYTCSYLFSLESHVSTVMACLKLDLEQIHSLFDSDHVLVKSGFFNYLDMNCVLQSNCTVKTEIASLFSRMETKNDFLEYGGTVIEEFVNELKKGKKKVTPEAENSSVIAEEKPNDDFIVVEEKLNHEDYKLSDEDEDLSNPSGSDGEMDLHDFLRKEVEYEKRLQKQRTNTAAADMNDDENSDELKPYSDNLEYLEEASKATYLEVCLQDLKRQQERDLEHNPAGRPDLEESSRRLGRKMRVAANKVEKRLALTAEKSFFRPRLLRLCEKRNLSDFERKVILHLVYCELDGQNERCFNEIQSTVGTYVRLFSKSLREQLEFRKLFGKNATLIREGILLVNDINRMETNIMNVHLSLDRRMLEFFLGVDSDFSELVEGSHLYQPKQNIANVILPDTQKNLILETVRNFETFKIVKKNMGLNELLSYGDGVCLLFYGASGTGKTMMANAIAADMNKKILLVNFPNLGNNGDVQMKLIFREAKINNAIVFFDECDSLFESRTNGNYNVNLLLTALEKHDGLVIMATNRAFDLDESMHRRITLALEFTKPDLLLREKIWKANLPEKMVLSDDVDMRVLADKYELSGGFIKNAILSAVSRAVGRDSTNGGKNCKICQEDFEHGCRLQLRGKLRMVDFHHRIIPKRGLEDMVLAEETKKLLNEVITFEKARQVLYAQWGFEDTFISDKGITCCFYGPPGTGKTLAAEAIAFSAGKPLKVVNTAALVSKYVGDTSKNLEAVFDEGKLNDAVLVFDDAEGLFGSRTTGGTNNERYANLDVGLLLYQMEHYPGIVVICTNLVETIDQAFHRRLRFVIPFALPNPAQRANLWRIMIPETCPLDENVDFEMLGRLFEYPGGSIKGAILRAAARAALRDDENRKLKMSDLLESGKEEVHKMNPHIDHNVKA